MFAYQENEKLLHYQLFISKGVITSQPPPNENINEKRTLFLSHSHNFLRLLSLLSDIAQISFLKLSSVSWVWKWHWCSCFSRSYNLGSLLNLLPSGPHPIHTHIDTFYAKRHFLNFEKFCEKRTIKCFKKL